MISEDKIIVTPEEIAQFRSQLTDYPAALEALQEIEECEGNLEDAATVLAIEAGKDPDRAPQWFEELVDRCRPILCQEDCREELLAGLLAGGVEALIASTVIPIGLATPVVIYAFKVGMNKYCRATATD